MITNKHLKELGFVFTGKQTAYFNLWNDTIVLIGDTMSITHRKKAFSRNIGYWELKYKIEEMNSSKWEQKLPEPISITHPDGTKEFHMWVRFPRPCMSLCNESAVYQFTLLP